MKPVMCALETNTRKLRIEISIHATLTETPETPTALHHMWVHDGKLKQESTWLVLVRTRSVERIYGRPTLNPNLEFRRNVCVIGEIRQSTNRLHKKRMNTKRPRQKDIQNPAPGAHHRTDAPS